VKTFSLRKEDVTRRWFVVDAAGQPLGRLASRVAQILRGKHKPTFTPHLNGGDCVVVVNAARSRDASSSKSATSGTPATWATNGSRPSRTSSRSVPSA